jgi:hypothetical protein
MPETLLGTSRVLLFGRLMADLQVAVDPPSKPARLVATDTIDTDTAALATVDGVQTAAENRVLLTKQKPPSKNGIYTVGNPKWTRLPDVDQPKQGEVVKVTEGSEVNKVAWIRIGGPNAIRFKRVVNPGRNLNLGNNHQLGNQLQGGSFARIYSFSYDGAYYELPRPVLFLVHGEGEMVTDPIPERNAARAPTDPTITGLAAADFQFADELRVWSYDKADYTIRMDVETGMFEQVLLDAYFSDGTHVSGMKVAGSRVSGMKVSGMKVSGMKVAGSRLGRGDASD